MRIQISQKGNILDGTLKQFSERRLYYALSRFASQIQTVKSAVEANKDSIEEFCCRIVVKPANDEEVVEECMALAAVDAVSRAAKRAGRSVGRILSR
jgi:hypothetical protein